MGSGIISFLVMGIGDISTAEGFPETSGAQGKRNEISVTAPSS